MGQKTFNRRITESIIDGTVNEVEIDGVRCYIVEPPRPDEEVVGYVSFSAFSHDHTPTEVAGRSN
jgi:hypothetical protein